MRGDIGNACAFHYEITGLGGEYDPYCEARTGKPSDEGRVHQAVRVRDEADDRACLRRHCTTGVRCARVFQVRDDVRIRIWIGSGEPSEWVTGVMV
jgi:hypothetical protein